MNGKQQETYTINEHLLNAFVDHPCMQHHYIVLVEGDCRGRHYNRLTNESVKLQKTVHTF